IRTSGYQPKAPTMASSSETDAQLAPIADDLGLVLPEIFAAAQAAPPPPRPGPPRRPAVPPRGPPPHADGVAVPVPDRSRSLHLDAGQLDEDGGGSLDLSRELSRIMDSSRAAASGAEQLVVQKAELVSEFEARERDLSRRLESALLERTAALSEQAVTSISAEQVVMQRRLDEATMHAERACQARLQQGAVELRAAEQHLQQEDRARLRLALDSESAAFRQQAREQHEHVAKLHAETYESQQIREAEVRQVASQATAKIGEANAAEVAAATAAHHHEQLAAEAARLESSAQAALSSTRLQLRQQELKVASLEQHNAELRVQAGRTAEMDAKVTIMQSKLRESDDRVNAVCDKAQAWCDGIAQQVARRDCEHTETIKALQDRLEMVEQECENWKSIASSFHEAAALGQATASAAGPAPVGPARAPSASGVNDLRGHRAEHFDITQLNNQTAHPSPTRGSYLDGGAAPRCDATSLQLAAVRLIAADLVARSLNQSSDYPPLDTNGRHAQICLLDSIMVDLAVEAGAAETMETTMVRVTRNHDSSSSSLEDEIRRRKGTVKKIEFDTIPAAAGFRLWLQEMYTKVCAASKRSTRRTLRWLQEVETTFSIEHLERLAAKQKRWDDLDIALAEAVLSVASGPLRRELLMYQEEQTRKGGNPLLGRCALYHVFSRFTIERGQATSVDLTTLVQLEYKGDLESFVDAWDYALMALARVPDDDMLLAPFASQLRKCKAMSPTFVHYDGAQDGSPTRSAKYLYDAARQEIVRRQREDTTAGLLKTPQKTAPAKTSDPKGKAANVDDKPLCKFWPQGKCTKGSDCVFKHVGPGKPTPAAVCRVPALPASDAHFADREWALDSGTGNDLAPPGMQGRRRHREDLCALETANGILNPTETVTVGLPELDEDAEVIELPNTLPALSLGRRCAQHGYDFHWPACADKPTFLKPTGEPVDIGVQNFVPVVCTRADKPTGDRRHVRCMPAAPSSEQHVGAGSAVGSSHPPDQAIAPPDAAPAAVREDPQQSPSVIEPVASAMGVRDPVLKDIERVLDDPLLLDAAIDPDPQKVHSDIDPMSPSHLATHLPKCAACEGCNFGKTVKSRSQRRVLGVTIEVPEGEKEFGALLHMDRLEMERGSEACRAAPYCLQLLDEQTDFYDPFPASKRDRGSVVNSTHEFDNETMDVRRWWSDSAPEFKAAATGMSERWWPLAICHWAACYNATRLDGDGRAPWHKRCGEQAPFKVYPFGALVLFKPPPGSRVSRVEAEKQCTKEWCNRLVPAILVGVTQGPAMKLSKSYLIAPLASIMADGRASRVSVRTVADVVVPDTVSFPLKQRLTLLGAFEDANLPAPHTVDDDEKWELIAGEVDEDDLLEYDGVLNENGGADFPALDADVHDAAQAAAQARAEAQELRPEVWLSLNLKARNQERERWKKDDPEGHAIQEKRRADYLSMMEKGKVGKGKIRALPAALLDCKGSVGQETEVFYGQLPAQKPRWNPPRRTPTTPPTSAPRPSSTSGSPWSLGFGVSIAADSMLGALHAVRNLPDHVDHLLVELCCSSDSASGLPAPANAAVFRVTAQSDLTRLDTVKFVKDIVKKASQKKLDIMHMNAANGVETGDLQLTEKLIMNAIKICEFAKSRGADITWEWPLRSDLWGNEHVRAMVNSLGGEFVKVATSAVERSHQLSGETIYTRKEWCLYTTDMEVRSAFAAYSCDKDADSKKFAWCRGRIARESAVCAPLFARIFWAAWSVVFQRAQAMAAKPATADTVTELLDFGADHRERDMPPCRLLWCALATRIVKPRSEEAKCEGARKAILKEVERMGNDNVWDPKDVYSLKDFLKHPTIKEAMLGRVFTILRVKGEEPGPELKEWKGRIVFQGSNVRTKSGVSSTDLFEEVSNAPASFAAARVALAVGALRGFAATLGDAEAACLQALIDAPGRVPTFVELPAEWWPDEWFRDGAARKIPKYDRPHCRLKKALYGHPEAGALWEAKLTKILMEDGWSQPSISHPGVWLRPTGAVLVMYVDDMMMVGSGQMCAELWKKLDRNVRFKADAEFLNRYPGAFYDLTPYDLNVPDAVRTLSINVDEYASNAVNKFRGEHRKPLHRVTSPYLDAEAWAQEGEPGGVFAATCASHVASLLFLSCVARPDISVVVQRLCAAVTRWTTTHDAALARVMAYLSSTGPISLVGTLSPCDLADCELQEWSDADWSGDPEHTRSTSGLFLVLASETSETSWCR
ncbi:unnamed protein product, partial [Prorocentrum cordatum]